MELLPADLPQGGAREKEAAQEGHGQEAHVYRTQGRRGKAGGAAR